MLVAIVTRLAPGLRDDLGFLCVVLGVEHDVLQAFALQHLRHTLELLDGDGADERGTALRRLEDVVDDGVPLFALGAIDQVRVPRCGPAGGWSE